MKFKPKHAFAAVALAIAGQAGAQVIHTLPDTGNSAGYFVVLDEVAGRSYFSELVSNAGSTTVGIVRMDDLISNPAGSWTITLSGLNAFAAGSASLDNLSGGFGAADSSATLGGGTTPSTGNRRFLTSVGSGGAAPVFTNSQVSSGATNYLNFATQANGACASSPCIATNPTQAAFAGIQNGSSGIGLQWGFPSGPSIGAAFAGGSIAWDIFVAATASNTLSLPASVTQLVLHAVLDLASNTLTISGPSVGPVPVPAAVYLFGSAVLGLMGIGRRKKAGEKAAELVAA